jgi:hypothetical protein
MTANDGGPPLPGVKRQWKTLADGIRKAYYYHRATGTSLPGEPGSSQFKTAYHKAERAAARLAAPERERFTVLLEDFLRSPEHARLAEGTRHNQRKAIDLMRARFAHLYVGDLNLRTVKAEFYEWRDEMAATPASADLRIGVLRRILSWAEERGKIEFNRAAGVKPLMQAGRNRSQITWTEEERQALLERGGERWRKTILLERFTAARESDLVRLDRAWIDGDGWLTFTPQKTARKTGVVVSLPTFALAPFTELLESLPKSGLLLPTSRGTPWSADSLRSLFYKLRTEVFGQGFGKSFHDFRGGTATELSDAGCSENEIAAIMGWAIGGEVPMSKNYVKRTRQLALNAYNKWQAAAFTEKGIVVPLRLA